MFSSFPEAGRLQRGITAASRGGLAPSPDPAGAGQHLTRGCGPVHTKNSHFLTPRDCGSCCLIPFCSHGPGGTIRDKQTGSRDIRCHVTVRGALFVPGCDAQPSEPLRISKVLGGQSFPIDICAIGLLCACTLSCAHLWRKMGKSEFCMLVEGNQAT